MCCLSLCSRPHEGIPITYFSFHVFSIVTLKLSSRADPREDSECIIWNDYTYSIANSKRIVPVYRGEARKCIPCDFKRTTKRDNGDRRRHDFFEFSFFHHFSLRTNIKILARVTELFSSGICFLHFVLAVISQLSVIYDMTCALCIVKLYKIRSRYLLNFSTTRRVFSRTLSGKPRPSFM